MKLRQMTLILAIALLGLISHSAVTASNQVPTTNIGAGTGSVGSYTISNLVYVHNTSSPQRIDWVNFLISPTKASFVKIQLTATGPWYACTNNNGNVNCPTMTPQALASAPDQLTVIASS